MAEVTGRDDADPFIQAGEYALGVLEGSDLSDARRAVLADPEFARAVEWWERRLAAMAEAGDTFHPSENVWRGIEGRLEGAEGKGASPIDRGPAPSIAQRWGLPAFVSGLLMAAASVILFLVVTTRDETPLAPPPQSQPAAPTPLLVAQLSDAESGRRLAGLIDPQRQRLALAINGLDAAQGRTPELWVIPEGADPVSLGAIPEGGRFERELSGRELALLNENASLAVTFEEADGTRHAAPEPPIVLVGALDRI